MGVFSNRVEKGDLKAGDHIYTWRMGFAYAHHGIYVGGNKVVHFSGDLKWISSPSLSKVSAEYCSSFPNFCSKSCKSGVIMSCLNCFLLGNVHLLYRFQYGVSKLGFLATIRRVTCSTAKSDSPKTVIQRAMYLLEYGFGKYNLFKNNCGHFALYCKTGCLILNQKGQGGSGQALNLVVSAAETTTIRIYKHYYASDPDYHVFKVEVKDVSFFLDIVQCEDKDERSVFVRWWQLNHEFF